MSKITEAINEINKEFDKKFYSGYHEDESISANKVKAYIIFEIIPSLLKASVEEIETEFYKLEELPKEFAVNQEIIRTRNSIKSKLLEGVENAQ